MREPTAPSPTNAPAAGYGICSAGAAVGCIPALVLLADHLNHPSLDTLGTGLLGFLGMFLLPPTGCYAALRVARLPRPIKTALIQLALSVLLPIPLWGLRHTAPALIGVFVLAMVEALAARWLVVRRLPRI